MLHDQATASSLGLMRIWVFGLAAVSRVYTPVWEMCYLPDYQPAGVMRLLGASYWAPLITPELTLVLHWLTIGLLVMVAAGVGPYRWMAPLSCVALTVAEGLVRGLGISTHANIILLLSCYLLALFPAADALTLFGKKRPPTTPPQQYRAALVSLSLLFCATYMLAAARRLSSSGIMIYFDDSILHSLALRDAELGPHGGLGIWVCESFLPAWSMRLGFPVVTLLEFLAPLCIFSKRFRWLWLAVMVPFHISTGWLMGIWFPYNMALIPFLVAGYDPFRQRSVEQAAGDVAGQSDEWGNHRKAA
ncbi:MAG: hypothetical protein QM703_27640 [Gemmatales bacterium]